MKPFFFVVIDSVIIASRHKSWAKAVKIAAKRRKYEKQFGADKRVFIWKVYKHSLP